MASRLMVVCLALLSVACAGSLEQARGTRIASRDLGVEQGERDTERCRSLDDRRTLWGAVAAGAGFIAGAQGVPLLVDDQAKMDRDLRQGLIGGMIIAGAGAAVAVAVEQSTDRTWARECSGP